MCKTEIRTQIVALDSITVADRIRKDNGDIDTLAQSIRERGLINPITLMEQTGGGYLLVAGLRRLNAVRLLGGKDIRATVISPVEADEALMLEIAENEQRKEFTLAERLAYAERIKAVEVEKSKQRQLRKAKTDGKDFVVANWPPQTEGGKTRDIVAKKAGFTSNQQMRRAEAVAEIRPDLLDKIDKNELSISGAYKEATRNTVTTSQPESGSKPLLIEERCVDMEPMFPFNPLMVDIPKVKSVIEGANHERLMKNRIYSQLFEHYQNAVQQVNLARGEIRTRSEWYERRIRAYEENAEAMRREIAQLKEALNART